MPCIRSTLTTVLGGLVFVCALSNAARAEDQPFLSLDATDIETATGREVEQNFGWNSGMSRRAFSEFEGETELEYGWSDKLKLAVATSVAWDYSHDHTVPPSSSNSSTSWGGITGEAVYQGLNVYFDPVGLAVLVAPMIAPDYRGVEAKLLLQKNFINDRLRFVVNAGGEFGSEKDGAWSDASALTFDAGLAYNITWEWSAALEFNAEHDFSGLMLNGRAMPEATSYYFGPTIQYVAHPWTASLGFQMQLPWSSDPTHTAGTLDGGYLAEAERTRVALRVTRDFY